jgi:hypothetical protein
MPVIRKFPPPESPEFEKAVKKIAKELAIGEPTGPKNSPFIIEEADKNGFLKIQVIWDGWKDLAPEDRGRAISRAYEEVCPSELDQTISMIGLTKDEAKKLGVES